MSIPPVGATCTALHPRPPPNPQASRLLACLLHGERRGSGDPYSAANRVVTVWRLLAVLNTQQLQVLSACPEFFDLPHSDAPEEALPAAALAAILEASSKPWAPGLWLLLCTQFWTCSCSAPSSAGKLAG